MGLTFKVLYECRVCEGRRHENKISKPSTYHSSSKTSNFLKFHQGVASVIELKID